MKKEKRNYGPYLLGFWLIIIIPLLVFCFLLYAAGNSWAGFDELPSFEQLENPKSNLATEVYTSDGKILGKYFYQNRVNVDYQYLSPNLISALVSTEDERYYEHSGIDLRGLARAILNAPKLLLIEDNLDAIDSEEKLDIIDYIRKKENKWTVIAATKNEYLISKADRIIELNEGEMSFSGTYAEYLNK